MTGSERFVILNIMIFLCVIGCQGENNTIGEFQLPEHVTVEMVDGVRFVHNGKIPFSDIQLEPELVLGEEESGIFFGGIGRLKEDREGNIYIRFAREGILMKFSNDGEYIRTIGRIGQGPGEFNKDGITDFGFFTDNRLVVYDQGAKAYQVFNSDGKLLDFIRRDGKEFEINSKNILYENRKIYTVPESADKETGAERVYLVRKVDPLFNTIGYCVEKNLKKPEKKIRSGATISADQMSALYSANAKRTQESSVIIKVDKKDNLYVLYEYKNLIEVYKADTLAQCIDRELHFDLWEPIGNGQPGVALDFSIDKKGCIYVLTWYRDYMEVGEKIVDERDDLVILLEIFNEKGWLTECIPIRGISARKIYVNDRNDIYLSDGFTYTWIRYKTIF
ncbi:6-bladed beta-propeller [candidate division KSB1 bacterium]